MLSTVDEGIYDPRGGLLSPKLYVDVPARPRKSDFRYTNFLPNFPPITDQFLSACFRNLTNAVKGSQLDAI